MIFSIELQLLAHFRGYMLEIVQNRIESKIFQKFNIG